jgi:hypothetical protein
MHQKGIDKRLDQVLIERNQKKEKLEQKYTPSFAPSVDPYVAVP